MKIIAIQDYQDFLGICQHDKPPAGMFQAFTNNYHAWGSGWNVRQTNEAGLEWLRSHKIRFAVWED